MYKQVQPAPLDEIDFTHHRRAKNRKKATHPRPKITPLSESEKENALAELRKILPNAAVFGKGDSDTDSASEGEENELPQPLGNIFQSDLREKGECAVQAEICKLGKLTLTSTQVENLEKATRGQHKTTLWHEHRAGRVTSSVAHFVLRARNPVSLIKTIMRYINFDISNIPACKWGLDCESRAREAYIKSQCELHEAFNCTSVGLVVPCNRPFIGASPDGIRMCKCMRCLI